MSSERLTGVTSDLMAAIAGKELPDIALSLGSSSLELVFDKHLDSSIEHIFLKTFSIRSPLWNVIGLTDLP